jgi:hypothetical protein
MHYDIPTIISESGALLMQMSLAFGEHVMSTSMSTVLVQTQNSLAYNKVIQYVTRNWLRYRCNAGIAAMAVSLQWR